MLPLADLTDEKCKLNSEDNVYVQYKCLADAEWLETKRHIGALSACLTALTALALGYFVRFKKGNVYWEKLELDMQQVTVSDYTLECQITPAQFQRLQRSQDAESKKTFGELLSEKLVEHGVPIDESHVADVNFVYQQTSVFSTLKARKKSIDLQKPTQTKVLNKKLHEILTENDNSTIYSAFVTFESETAVRRVRELKSLEFLGQNTQFWEAAEPSDIIWENKWISQRFWYIVKFVSVIGCMMLATFFLLFYVKLKAETAEHKYTRVNCSQLEE